MEERTNNNEAEKMDEVLLPGFRFHPTDEELVGFYLKRKIQQRPLSIELIKQLDIYKYDPWDLPKFATTGEKEWYFYCPRDRKYRNSARPNRVTGAGFWKATGTDRPIYSSEGNKCIGLKKSLVFYKGKAAKGIKTDWMMHEFRLPSLTDHSVPQSKRFMDKTIPANDSWAICRIFKKSNSTAQRALSHSWVSPLPTTEANPTKPTDMNGKDSYNGNNNITQSNISSDMSYKTSSSLHFNYNNILGNDHHHHHHHHPSTTNATTTATFSPFDFAPYKPILANQMFLNNKAPQLPLFAGDLPASLLFSPFEATTTTATATTNSSLANKCSNGSIDLSSMLLNMSSSLMFNGDHHHHHQCIDFGGAHHDHHQCNGFSTGLPVHEMVQVNNVGINHEDEINILMKNQNMMPNDHRHHDIDEDHHDHDQWGSTVRSINGFQFNLPLMSMGEGWNKPSPMSMWDSSSCPSDQKSTSTVSTNKCYT